MNTEKIFSFNSPELTFTRRITHSPKQTSFPLHSHPFIEIVMTSSGNHAYVVEGREIFLSPGDVIIIAPGIPHRVEALSDEYDRYSVIIHPSLLPEVDVERLCHGVSHLSISRGDDIVLLLEKAERYAKELPPETHSKIYPAMAIELFYMLLSREPKSSPTASDIINRALAYIDAHFTEIESIGEVCDHLYVSKSYFHALFREHMKKTPLAYLNERRLYLASTKIAAGAKPTAVYRECGFDDYTSFYRAYKRLYGRAPSVGESPFGDEGYDF